MKKAFIVTLVVGAAISAYGQPTSGAGMRSNFVAAPTTQAEVQEDEVYNRGTAALNDSQWQKALDAFQQVAKSGGRRADGALYWKAYTENKMGNRSAAAGSIAELRKQFPKSSWLKDARALEVEMKQDSGQAVHPANDDDEDLKLQILNGLMGSDEERVIPMLQKMLDGNQSKKVKERVLFVLSQSDSPKAQQLMGTVARGQAHPDLQKMAIRNLGINGTTQNKQTLEEIYKSSNDVSVKREVLQSLGIAGDREHLFAIAHSEKNAEMTDAVIQALAIAGADQQLRQLYKEYTDPAMKSRVLQSSIITGDMQLVDFALKTDTNPKLRREAIHVLGIHGGKGASTTLESMYQTEKDKDVKEAAIEALFISDDAHTLITLAKKETDKEMRRRIIEKLSVMGNREANDYMMELLNK